VVNQVFIYDYAHNHLLGILVCNVAFFK